MGCMTRCRPERSSLGPVSRKAKWGKRSEGPAFGVRRTKQALPMPALYSRITWSLVPNPQSLLLYHRPQPPCPLPRPSRARSPSTKAPTAPPLRKIRTTTSIRKMPDLNHQISLSRPDRRHPQHHARSANPAQPHLRARPLHHSLPHLLYPSHQRPHQRNADAFSDRSHA